MADFKTTLRRARRRWKRKSKTLLAVAGVVVLAIVTVAVVAAAITKNEVPVTAQPPVSLQPATPTATASAAAPSLPPVPSGSTVMFIGDSWTYATGADNPKQGFAYVTAGELGVVPEVHGYGSVGYAATGADKFGAFQARLAYDKPTSSPSLVVLQGSQNDGKNTPQEITSAAKALIVDVRSRFPGAGVLMVGPAPATVGLMSSLVPVDAALDAAAAAEKVPYVSPLTDGWFNAGNLAGYMNPMDGSPHPNTAGHKYFADNLTASIRALQG